MVKMKKFLIGHLIVSIFFSKNLLSQENNKEIYVFMVDLSMSMLRDSLFESVKRDLRRFIPENLKIGDRVILSGFGDDVRTFWDDEINTTEDFQRICWQIEKLQFNHRYTHMSRAFDILAKRMEEINAKYPNVPKYIYVYTDGINEPPPESHESPIEFQRILREHWGKEKMDQLNAYLFYISFGIEPPREIDTMAKEIPQVKILEYTRKPEEMEITPKLQIIKISSEKNFFSIPQNKKVIEFSLKTEAETEILFNDTISLKILPEGKIEPYNFEIKEKVQTQNFKLYLPKLSPGERKIHISFETKKGSILNPLIYEITLKILPTKPFILKILKVTLPIFLILLITLWLILIPRFENEDIVEIYQTGQEILRYKIRNGQRFYSNKVIISQNLNVPNLDRRAFVLMINRGRQVFIKPLKSEVLINNNPIDKKRWTELTDGTIFLVGNRMFKFER